MKLFLKYILLIILLIEIHTASYSQLMMGTAFRLPVPVGKFSDFGLYGFGGGPVAKYFLNSKIALAAEIGSMSIYTKKIPNLTNRYYFVFPLLVGVNYFFTDKKIRPFIGIYAGPYINHYRFDQKINDSTTVKTRITHTFFGISPEIGCLFRISRRIDLQLDFRYNIQFVTSNSDLNPTKSSTTFNYFGLRIGWFYKFGKKQEQKESEKDKDKNK